MTAPVREASDTTNKVSAAVFGCMLWCIANTTSVVMITINPANTMLRPATRLAGYHKFGLDIVRGVRKP